MLSSLLFLLWMNILLIIFYKIEYSDLFPVRKLKRMRSKDHEDFVLPKGSANWKKVKEYYIKRSYHKKDLQVCISIPGAIL